MVAVRSRILDSSGKPFTREVPSRRIRAKYDAAQTVDDNRRHWTNADALSARAANSSDVRLTLRKRSRYEIANNSYARGITLTLANDLIGTGPRLQMLLDDDEANRIVEDAYAEWTEAIGLADKLSTMKLAKTGDGEAFGVFTNNPRLPTSVQLDLRLYEADQFAEPRIGSVATDSYADGITFDADGNPIAYTLLDDYPGDYGSIGKFSTLPARNVLHWFRADRPGQVRGIPEVTPALPLFAQLRRFTLAVIAAAETAADFAAVLATNLPANEEEALTPFSTQEIEQRMMTALPPGYSLSQLKAENPSTTYAMFKGEILNEIARCLNVPFNVAAGNSASYNYASGRMDWQIYHRAVSVERSQLKRIVLDRIFYAWINEAVMVPGLLPSGMNISRVPHRWFFDGAPHVDPVKEATADQINLEMHATTLAELYAEQGQDWRDAVRQRAKEVAFMREMGLSEPAQTGMQRAAQQQQEQGATA